ncbi:MAG: hypothetical protein DMG80_10770 [Acidobacteria bacterium]|nr:MAG: hypothetical protein DMG80_10770 [Acidobacteriota bacterium]
MLDLDSRLHVSSKIRADLAALSGIYRIHGDRNFGAIGLRVVNRATLEAVAPFDNRPFGESLVLRIKRDGLFPVALVD